ncbi:MAG: Stp1/IreP family PP2C-type Ser/Thr phosphatase [Myxococcales bacterium]|nr:Stp1/IreP family PP2C-type Ser/Thr phosphatase [Myxococcales bacterium]
MASGLRSRPPTFTPGMNLSDYYKVEALIRLAEGRMFYVVNDARPDRRTRRCWECGFEDNPAVQLNCGACSASLATRRFLLSTRWERDRFDPYLKFFQKQLEHPALLSPCDVFPYPDENPSLMCSVVPFANEAMMLDEAAPLPIERVVAFAQRAAGTIGFLAFNGVRLAWLHRSNFAIRAGGEFVLFDPEVAAVEDHALTAEEYAPSMRQLGEILRRYTPLEERSWQALFLAMESGEFGTSAEFGQALQQEAHRHKRQRLTRHAGITDVGLLRSLNEDNWGWSRLTEGVEIFVVADGMGGHDSGEVASQLAVDTLVNVARDRVDVTPRPTVSVIENILDEAFQEANNTIKGSAEMRGNDMGTTLVTCMVVDDQMALCANVGDSRGYLVRNGTLHQITRDHSLVARMVEQNRITAEEARTHPHSNILLRTVGTERNVDIDIFQVELEEGDRIVLCSDGLWGEVEDSEIEQICASSDDNRAISRQLVRAAHMGGGKDNITVLVISVPGTGSATVAPERSVESVTRSG